jgi:hypothetical protein
MKINLRKLAIASAAFACAALLSPGWSGQGGLTLSVSKADAHSRLYVGRHYAASAVYVHSAGLPWYAVRAYYWDGPWSGPGYSYSGWADYRARAGIGCDPGTTIVGGDGIPYVCQ